MRTRLVLAAAVAAAVAVPAVSPAGPDRDVVPAAARTVSAADGSLLGLRRGPGGRGLMLRQPLTARSAVGLSFSSGSRKERPETRVTLGLHYTF